MYKTTQRFYVFASVSLILANIFSVNAGNAPSSRKKTSPHSSSRITSTPPPISAEVESGCLILPPDKAVLQKYMKSGREEISEGMAIPSDIQIKIKSLVKDVSKAIDMKRTTRRTGTRNFTFVKDTYSETDSTAIATFVRELLPDIKPSRSTSASTEITCHYTDFIIKAYTTIHTLTSYPQQFKALQMILAGLKEQNKYMLDKSQTDRILSLDPSKVTHFVFTLIREPIGQILQPGDLAILVAFPDIKLFYSIR